MDYNVKTQVRLGTNFNTADFNALLYESAQPFMIEDIKSVIEADPTLSEYIDGDLTFRFLENYDIVLKYTFNCNDKDEAEAESFSKSCVEDIRCELEEKGYKIKWIKCKAEEMDMKWLDELEDIIFSKSPKL